MRVSHGPLWTLYEHERDKQGEGTTLPVLALLKCRRLAHISDAAAMGKAVSFVHCVMDTQGSTNVHLGASWQIVSACV